MNGRALTLGASILAAVALLAALAPVLPLRDPNAQPDGLVLRNLPPMTVIETVSFANGTTQYAHELRREADGGLAVRRGDTWTDVRGEGAAIGRARFVLGTDALGRDLLSRLVWGTRVSLVAGLLAALVAVIIGGGIGLIAGFSGGWVDAALMRATDGALAIPRLFLILLLAALFRPSLSTTVLLVGCTTWMAAARLVRGCALSIREREFVASARAAGASPVRVAMHHVLPQATAVLGVEVRSAWARRSFWKRRFRFWGWACRLLPHPGAG